MSLMLRPRQWPKKVEGFGLSAVIFMVRGSCEGFGKEVEWRLRSGGGF
jgi:hypothetical protein